MVKFGDESKVEISGIGSIIFEAKNSEHQVLHGVYYSLVLQNLIMSLGQLNKGGSKVEIEDDVLRIWDQCKRLLIKVRHGANHLYTSSTSTWPSCSASPLAKKMKPGGGTSGTTTSTLMIFTNYPRVAWHAGCQ